jgi:hypothetical protein
MRDDFAGEPQRGWSAAKKWISFLRGFLDALTLLPSLSHPSPLAYGGDDGTASLRWKERI